MVRSSTGLMSRFLTGVFLLVTLAPTYSQAGVPARDLSGLVGEKVSLPCVVDTDRCSALHSIKWYRGSARIFVFSEKAKIARAEGDYTERAEMKYNGSLAQLEVRDLHVADEALYRCEITYIEVRDGCAVVQFINLTTLIKPEYVKVRNLADGSSLEDGALIGPYKEGDPLQLECESGGGKPVASVSWWNGTRKLKARYEQKAGSNGAGTGVATLVTTLSRGDLRAVYECRATNDALDSPLRAALTVLVHVRPQSLALSGVVPHVVQGTGVAATCVASGANPSASITWYNGTDVIGTADEDVVKEEEDGTFTTTSRLIFTATLYENDRTLHCDATNPVIKQKGEKPMRESVSLEVLYPPIVTVKPDNITVNESTDITLECDYVANPSSLQAVRWYRDKQLLTLTADHYEGGTTDQTTLVVKNASRHDQGVYDCGLENDVGSQNSSNSIFVNIYFKPVVRLTMESSTPVSELARLNITLLCEVDAGNPPALTAVRWYLDGDLLKELPECNGTDTFCDVDPSKLLLEDVGRGFHANYSCEGMNDAGWGPVSPDQELVVYYPPGPATLVYEPSRVVKKGAVTLSCSVEDPGRPETSKYRWLRGSHLIHNMTAANWTIDPVTLETDSNFTCFAYNEGGEGEPATVYIEVAAPPDFIERTPPYYGALLTSQHINISCRVECSPPCEVNWLKNNALIDLEGDGSLYAVTTRRLPPNSSSNDFASVQSTLHWNMSAWPGGQLDIFHDSANYTCLSTSNSVGPGVRSTTLFGVEYPPENITVSNQVVFVTEGHVPEKVICSAKAYPEATYVWRREGEKDVAIKGKTLILNYPLKRTDGGNYVCEASNRHGSVARKTSINVLFKPECGITQTESEGKLILTCAAKANPPEVDFAWRIKNDNDSFEGNVEKRGAQSVLILDTYVDNFRTYLCYANNSVGTGIPCERDVTAQVVNWWGKFEKDHLIVIIAVIVAAILMVIIICIIIIIVCRRKRADEKYNNPVEMEERENPEGNLTVTSTLSQSGRPVHKWPLRPGVLVHVNGSHSLNLGRLDQPPPYASSTMPKNPSCRKKKCARKLKQRRASSLGNLRPDETNQLSRATRIRQMFLNDGETLPGVFHGKSGVVTFKKLDGMSTYGTSRKRKKPGSGPNPSATKDKSKPDVLSSARDGFLHPEGDKAFYENLPFHGMQTVPNKPASPNPQQGASRPSSQQSQCGSSGYGSTRSHVGPHLLKKSQSLRLLPRRSRVRAGLGFYSMRLHRKDRAKGKEEAKDILLERLPRKGRGGSEAEELGGREGAALSEAESSGSKSLPPTPAPRKHPAGRPVKHTYQNVPIPISPNSQEVSPFKSELHQHHHHHHHHYSPPPPVPPPPLFGNVAGRSLLPPVRLEFQQPYYVTGSSVVYADLALSAAAAAGGGPGACRPPHYGRRPPTEYAVLKFRDVGQEIDV